MTWNSIANIIAQSATANTITSGAIDTSGANTLFVAVSWYVGAGGGAVLSDSKGNTWIGLTDWVNTGTSGNHIQLYYAKNATVGAGHTFTVTGTASFPSLIAAAFSGGDTTAPYDATTGENSNGSGGTSGQPGSITPSINNELLLTMVGNQTSDLGATSINSSFNILQVSWRQALAMGVGLAYKIQTSAAAENPTWSWSSADAVWLSIQSFISQVSGAIDIKTKNALVHASIKIYQNFATASVETANGLTNV